MYCRPLDVVFLTPLGVCSFGFLTDLVARCLKDHTNIKVWVVTNDGLDLTSVLRIPITFSLEHNTVEQYEIRIVVVLYGIRNLLALIHILATNCV